MPLISGRAIYLKSCSKIYFLGARLFFSSLNVTIPISFHGSVGLGTSA
ncbi:hypothetical protein APHCRT_1430 [Anaplasma phagocytophilum str. CRT53-1]|uniref:Uncharacterized protein n=1 Tax=Anaplasma phagocytophilum str. CRT53-1 TaxID=1359157 RepID=A0A0F3PPU1_ANAPH|nr:hypothetical protein APHCRT_1430 [Anaplasma phagocytophilum str. CRT53-1]